MPVEATNLTKGEADALAAVFRDVYGEQLKQPLLKVPVAESTGAVNYAEQARELAVEQYLVLRAIRLEHKVTVRATLYSNDGKQLNTAKRAFPSLDEAEIEAERLIESLFVVPVVSASPVPPSTADTPPVALTRPKKANVDAESKIVSEPREVADRASRPAFVEKVFGAKVQLVQPVASQLGLKALVGVGFNARLEGASSFIEFGAGFSVPASDQGSARGGYGGLYGELGGNVYLTDSEASIYVGGGVMPRIILTESAENSASLSLYAQAGLMFLRSSSVRLYSDFRVGQNVKPISVNPTIDDGFGDPNPQDDETIYPTEFGFSMGVGW